MYHLLVQKLKKELGKKFKSRLGANESVFGPSESVINAMKTCIANDIWNMEIQKILILRLHFQKN